jgi:hypothetical protein
MRVFSALLWVSGVSPSQAAKSRPLRNRRGSPSAVTSAWAVSGPTPGIWVAQRASVASPD